MKLSILIPTFNEERTIGQLVERVLATRFPIEYELLLIDDHSTDRTFAIERALCSRAGSVRVRVLRNRTNKGKGACIRQGIKHATGDFIVVQDGDLEYHPGDLPALLAPLLDGTQGLAVFGSRFLGNRWPAGMTLPHFLANKFLTWLTNCLYGLHLTDMECCYKIIPAALVKRIRVRADRFEAEPELVAKLARTGIRIMERPVQYEGRTVKQGKKIRALDFFLAVWTLLRYDVAPDARTIRPDAPSASEAKTPT